MRSFTFLPFAALAACFVIPDEQLMNQIVVPSEHELPAKTDHSSDDTRSVEEVIRGVEDSFEQLLRSSRHSVHQAFQASKTTLDDAIDYTSDTVDEVYKKAELTALDSTSWLESVSNDAENAVSDFARQSHYGHHKKPNHTVYELIAKSKYTTKLAALINEYPDLVETLNGTVANYTVFAPIDKAFEKIPDDAPKPSKEQLKQVLLYHVSDDFYPAGRVLVSRTIPSLLKLPDTLGDGPQRLSTNIGLKLLTVNFYSRIIAINIFGTNGVIHGVDSVLIPPPNAAEIIQLLPGEFSTLELGLTKTGLLPVINDTSNHVGGTLFAPSNFAFQKLGPKINAFLFSKYGLKYLRALLKYHVVPNKTLYSDAYYDSKSKDAEENSIPKGYYHLDLPTILHGKSLSIDVGRFGRLIEIKINGFSRVTISDGIASDGVIHVVGNVLLPPKGIGEDLQQWDGESEISLEEFKERLEPYAANAEL